MRLTAFLVATCLGGPLASADPPRAEPTLPVGTWRVEYSNGVTEVCEIRRDGVAAVIEPVRISGKAAVNGSAVVVVFENGRVQRWTPVGKRYVMEHWFPGSQFPTAAPGAHGIAERTP